ncbi:hypothetical protein DPMN_022273 [Dreissena polymorpha]|uniref:Uncharacterized protein n=1 Tax=Dreissena polymorpha TaxID=45954 RepID=A0A9D4NP52_DREPO|nr:hypothetical protein DPMN_022273 [Dreissena polymorpha]
MHVSYIEEIREDQSDYVVGTCFWPIKIPACRKKVTSYGQLASLPVSPVSL